LQTKDVIHPLKIIALRVCQDAIPGLRIPVWFTPTKTGRYQINSPGFAATAIPPRGRLLGRQKPGGLRQMDQIQERHCYEL
jgi:hypothetical protein